MSHTPGPWRQDGRLVIDTRDDAVAMVNVAREVTTAHADARLIAVAPDLLAALRDAQTAFRKIGERRYHTERDAHDIAREADKAISAAIAKAEGK